MSTKFFNNTGDNTLFDKLKGIAKDMVSFERFLAVAGYFRSSGYFKLRAELDNVEEIKILVGINIDDIFRKLKKNQLFFSDPKRAVDLYSNEFKQDILDAQYTPEVEKGILQMCEDLKEGRLEIRIHDTHNLHAKFYLCLPKNHNENSDGWVIMGSSNLTDAGLGILPSPRYELNVAMKDYDDVKYCCDEFEDLWSKSVPITLDDVEKSKKDTHLGYQPTPYELYIKVLINTFGDQVEDKFSMELPTDVLDLKYQRDAMIQGYKIMMKHNGVFLADVVGLGKTLIATMITKRFIEENGSNTNILVIYPPSLEENWKSTFKLFDIKKRNAQFVSNGSLSKVLDEKNQYKGKEEFDLIIVDEAHGFRNDGTSKYNDLQRICKSPCLNKGALNLEQKRVLLLSATPLNNKPEDLQNLLLLFQDSQKCTIDGVPNLKNFFSDKIARYKRLMAERDDRDVTDEVDKLYEEIREGIIDKVTIRRTRNNILNDPDYKADVEKQGITFPTIEKPQALTYQMSEITSERFYRTLSILSKDEGDDDELETPYLTYARYRAVEFLKEEYRSRYPTASHIGETLKGIYRVHMVKRLESSFYAFKKSLQTLLRITENMIVMFEKDKVLIIPDTNVNDMLDKGMELDEIIEKAIEKGYLRETIEYKAECFVPEFLEMLKKDRDILIELNEDWSKEEEDPKFDKFKVGMEKEFFEDNNSGKLVLFSESVDTLSYLYNRLTKELGKKDILMVTSNNRKKLEKTIRENFDANNKEQKNDYNIILSSDVLAEGINLHRSNVIINYDSPWNATRLMQRIGRINRIGTKAERIHNYMFYPSRQGDREIQLYKNALIKLQGFHSAFGEDAQIYSEEEIVKQFNLFDSNIRDNVDMRIKYLREVRELYEKNPNLYKKIKDLPMKSRTMRDSSKYDGTTIVFIQSNIKSEYYYVTDKEVKPIDFLEAAKILKATPDEKALPFNNERKHYDLVNKALKEYVDSYDKEASTSPIYKSVLDKNSRTATNFLHRILQQVSEEEKELKRNCETLISYVERGRYNQLPKELLKLKKVVSKKNNNGNVAITDNLGIIKEKIDSLVSFYGNRSQQEPQDSNLGQPKIIISETFISK